MVQWKENSSESFAMSLKINTRPNSNINNWNATLKALACSSYPHPLLLIRDQLMLVADHMLTIVLTYIICFFFVFSLSLKITFGNIIMLFFLGRAAIN